MVQVLKQAFVTVPATEIESHPVDIFPGATVGDLYDALNSDPEFPLQVSINETRVVTHKDGGLQVFGHNDDIYSVIEERAVLEIMPAHPPVMGQRSK